MAQGLNRVYRPPKLDVVLVFKTFTSDVYKKRTSVTSLFPTLKNYFNSMSLSAYHSPLLDIGLSNCTVLGSILGFTLANT